MDNIGKYNNHQLINILKNYIFPQIEDQLLKQNENKIISYFKENKISGNKLYQMSATQINSAIITYCKADKALIKPLNDLRSKLIQYKPQSSPDQETNKSRNNPLPQPSTQKSQVNNIHNISHILLIANS